MTKMISLWELITKKEILLCAMIATGKYKKETEELKKEIENLIMVAQRDQRNRENRRHNLPNSKQRIPLHIKW